MAKNKQEDKEYIFSNTVTITEETGIFAKTYEEAEKIYLRGGGTTDQVWNSGGDWECIYNPDDQRIKTNARHIQTSYLELGQRPT